MCGAQRSWCRQLFGDGVQRHRSEQGCSVKQGGAGSGIVVAEALTLLRPSQRCGTGRCFVTLTSGVHRPQCGQGCLVTTLESMVLVSVDWGCGGRLDGA
ncbi:hypothetical protein NDU88_003698 [Pleurodeles waltl]|uniref:Uncharacterized protein n=1 Tax=Pleurodeles waltl TaxID=8319 RepID=A0AAV7T6J6_PLEWA|nr:hypothetical protein NDU88_003698 [Pleurodeles waltl]